ncbi:MAG: RNA polymerase sigma factor [Flavobacteriales bacterium]
MQEQEHIWIRQAQAGNQQSFYLLMGKFWDPLLLHLNVKFPKSKDNEDICIIAFTKAFRNIKQMDTQFAFSTWLFTIANHTAIDLFRTQKKHLSASCISHEKVECLMSHIPCPNNNPEQALIVKQNINQLMLFLDTMKPQYKTILELRYLKDLKIKDIASELNLPIGSVKANLSRARTILISSLGEAYH